MKRSHLFAWLLLWAIASAWLSTTDYRSSSNDSKFYNRLVVQLADKPVREWIAPKWGENYWGHPPDKYIHDHLVGNLIPGVLLAKVGVPPQHALNIAQMLFNMASLFLLVWIASHFIREEKSWHLLWMLQLIPIAFTYKIRANHEQGMMFWMLLAILGAVFYFRYGRGLVYWVLGVVGVLLVKGAPVVLMPVMAVLLGLVLVSSVRRGLQTSFKLIAIAVFSMLAVGYLYEELYQMATGRPFWSEYWRVQITERSYEQAATSAPWLMQKLSNFWYYLNRSFFYSAPLSIFALVLFLRNFRETSFRFELTERRKFYLIMFTLGILQILAFSTSNRRGSRYIFPVFYMFGAGFSVYLLAHSAWLRNWVEKLEKKNAVVLVAASLWFVTFVLHLGKLLIVAK